MQDQPSPLTPTSPSPLTQIILSLLTPLMLASGITDTALARSAAQEAIAAYPPGGPLLTISQIVAFAMVALDNLRLSMVEDLALSMKLKLRGNAAGLNRASLLASRTLGHAETPEPTFEDWIDTPEPPAAEPPAQEPVLTTLPVVEQNRRHWANAMATVAAELQARAAQTPPAQRKSDQLWIEVLANVAGDLRQPDSAPPAGLSKADLFRTTLMAGSGGFPAHLIAKTKSRRANR